MALALVFLVAGCLVASSAEQPGGFQGYNYPKPTTPAPFGGYNYPKPSKPFNEGYVYTTPKCPLVLPSTSTVTDYQTVVSTTSRTETLTLPPITSTRFETSFVTLPPIVQTQTDTTTQFLTVTSTEFVLSTTTEIRPTTVTSLTTYCAPNTYLPPPTPPPNSYLPVDPPAKEYLPQLPPSTQMSIVRQSGSSAADQGTGFISTFVQQQSGPIKRATAIDLGRAAESEERTESNEVLPSGSDQLSQPSINIIYVDRQTASNGQPPEGLMNWLLCKFNLNSGTCADN